MLLKARIRGNGGQLGWYLASDGENEQVRIMEVDGKAGGTKDELKELLKDFSRNEMLTRSRQGIYHASINPPEEIANRLTDDQWTQAVEIMAEELGFSEQRRAVVMHQKYGRKHIHIAWERYDHEKGTMIVIDHNYRKHDKARARLEVLFNEKPTPKRNPKRDELKSRLTNLWQETRDAKGFVQGVRQWGYMVSNGFGRSPYMIVDETGRSFNLVRHLDNIKLKDVRDRFKDTVLPQEKAAIAFVRTQQHITRPDATAETDPTQDAVNKPNTKVSDFAENLAKLRTKQQARPKGPRPR